MALVLGRSIGDGCCLDSHGTVLKVTLSRQNLRDARTLILRLLPPGNPITLPEIVQAQEVITALSAELESMVQVERGRKVLEWRLRTNSAPTQNEASQMKGWIKKTISARLDKEVIALMASTPDANAGQRCRWVRITRFTTQPKNVDEVRADGIGGKLPIDALVRNGVLYEDNRKYLVREAHVAKTTPGNTHVLIEVFETAAEEVPCGPPQDVLLAPVEKKKTKAEKARASFFGRAIAAGDPGVSMMAVPATTVVKKSKKKLPAVSA